ncbi:MAG: hypothetical protein Q8L86_04610 [Vicinamibacterales bacterium]|nr:hypothetical protein [Vicinamibacterales bacterium]
MTRGIQRRDATVLSIAIVIAAVVLGAVACSGGPTAPTPPPAVPSSSPQPPAASFVFKYQDGVASEDRADIEATAPAVKAYFDEQFGKTLSGTITFDVRFEVGPNASGTAGNNTVTIYTLSPFGWTNVGKVLRVKTIAHELFHILQQQAGWSGFGWLLEGSAEYAGYRFVADTGLVSFDIIKSCQIYNYGTSHEPPLQELERMFSAPDNRYAIAWQAWHHLLDIPGFRSIGDYLGWGSFSSAFGRSLSVFYDDFEVYRRTLQPTAATVAACQILHHP